MGLEYGEKDSLGVGRGFGTGKMGKSICLLQETAFQSLEETQSFGILSCLFCQEVSVKPRGKLSHSSSAAGQYLLLLSVNTLFHVAEVFEYKNAS